MQTTHHRQGEVAVDITRHTVAVPDAMRVPYEGADPAVHAAFPDGFVPSFGSGLALRDADAHGYTLYALSDRGPNGDGPMVPSPVPGADGVVDSKFFPAPSYAPAVALLQIDGDGARIVDRTALQTEAGAPANGLPLPPRARGWSAEVPLLEELTYRGGSAARFDWRGLDPEALAYDRKRGVWWVADEYGPYLLKVDCASGVILARFAPGAGLPPLFEKRRVNRGLEGMCYDEGTDRVHLFLQSPLSDGKAEHRGKRRSVENYAPFTRWARFDPVRAETDAMYAYPLHSGQYEDGKTGKAKLGDMAALGDGRFVVIEQGTGADGKPFNHLMLADIREATDIGTAPFNPHSADLERSAMAGAPVDGADWSAVRPIAKTLLLDLNAAGWTLDKAEGIALLAPDTVALSSDNDFGLRTALFDREGREIGGDVTACGVDADGKLQGKQDWCKPQNSARIVPLAPEAAQAALWVLRFAQPLLSYEIPVAEI
ncbi:MAG TPA: esterase-like activity of phytase family protein [Burkholderiaceae bacterium]